MSGVDGNQDDPSIQDHFRLLRRVPIQIGMFIVWHENLRAWRISSAAFSDHGQSGTPMSVHIKEVLLEIGLPIESVMAGHEQGFGLVSFSAGEARSLGQIIQRDPREDAPAHAHVIGNKTQSVRKKLANAAVWEIRPANLPDSPG